MNILVLFGGPSPEHDVSVLTGLQAARALRTREAIYWTRAGEFTLVDATLEGPAFADGTPRGAKPLRLATGDGFVAKSGLREKSLGAVTVVNCCHGSPGEDGTLQGSLDLAGVTYTGPSGRGAALGMDKLAFGALCAAGGLSTLPRAALAPGIPIPFDGPYIVKPRFGGSSIGIDTVRDHATALDRLGANPHLAAGAVIEPLREGALDLNVAVRMFPEPQLSAIEKPTRSEGSIYAYAEKYAGGQGMLSAARELPAVIDASIEKDLRSQALTAAGLAGVRGIARIDFLLDGDQLYLNEINTIPGSLARHLWVEPAVAFEQLLADLVAEAAARPTAEYSALGADGAVLRGAGSIAAKLA
jgi:D-alanine-D-alanine ligase